uniref:DUF5857 domain-containing protein n=1 Tax=viral metagenome TaxID=1070528 RepID=A0A6C0CGH9_9ZZZZ
MGCSSSATQNQKPPNFCGAGDSIGQLADVKNSCFFTTDVGKYCGGEQQYCFGQAQGSTEWIANGGGGGCGVCSSCNGLEDGTGNGLGNGAGGFSWAGVHQSCKRVAFNGDPLTCCRRSPNINGSSLFCFDDNTGLRTCDPQYRGFAQPSCTPLMAAYCSNDSGGGYQGKWSGTPATSDCLRYLQETAGNLSFYGPVVEAMATRYLITDNHPITSSQTSGSAYDPFIETVVQTCRANAGACDAVLKAKCAGVTRDQLSNNVNLANLCGCFMPDLQYASHSSYGIKRECDPVCVIASAVGILDPATSNPAQFLKCNQSVCVIDDVSINILANSVTGPISFSQACGSCAGSAGTGSCRCYIENVSITSINSLIGDVSFNQQCGGQPLCYKSAPVAGAPPIQVDCGTGTPLEGSSTETTSGTNPAPFLWIALAIMGVIILVVILISTSSNKKNNQTFIVQQSPARSSRPLIGSNVAASGLQGDNKASRPQLQSRGTK